MKIIHLGLMSYADALHKMDLLHSEVVQTPGHQGYILLVEHPPTVTMGNRNNTQDLLFTPESLRAKKIDYFKIDRGGSVTVHEPGQCVVYPIFNIFDSKKSVKSYVHALESAMIDTCQTYGIKATRDPINPGIWVGKNKIGAVGIRILNKVTKHGIAFNVNNSLKTFSYIIPCGLRERGVTNLKSEIYKINPNSEPLNLKDVSALLLQHIETYLKE